MTLNIKTKIGLYKFLNSIFSGVKYYKDEEDTIFTLEGKGEIARWFYNENKAEFYIDLEV